MAKSKQQERDDLDLDLEKSAPAGAANAQAAKPKRHRQDKRPLCPKHGVQMVADGTNAMFTYYRCPKTGCRERDKQVRPVGPFTNLYGNGKSERD